MNYITRDDVIILQGSTPITQQLIDIIKKFGKLQTSVYFNQCLDNILPDNILEIEFGIYFNQKIDNLPSRLIKLVFNYFSLFNQSIDNLPETLEYLALDGCFNQTVDNLPNNLIYLSLGYNFNQPIDNLPDSIQILIIGEKFDRIINKLPKKLEFLCLKKTYIYSNDIIHKWNNITIYFN